MRNSVTKLMWGSRLLTLWIVFVASTYGAPSEAQATSLGLRGGLTFGGVLWEDPYAADQMGVRRGPHVGGLLAIGISRWLEIEVDALWSRKGFDDHGGAHFGAVESDYLELPALVRFRIPGRVSPHLMLGPTAAVQLRCRVSGVAGIGAGSCDDPFIGTSRSKLDLGVVLGLGVSYPVVSGSLFLDALGDLGLRDFKQDPLPPGFARNVAIHLSLGFSVPLSRQNRERAGTARKERDR
jgi:hypothetical protein